MHARLAIVLVPESRKAITLWPYIPLNSKLLQKHNDLFTHLVMSMFYTVVLKINCLV